MGDSIYEASSFVKLSVSLFNDTQKYNLVTNNTKDTLMYFLKSDDVASFSKDTGK